MTGLYTCAMFAARAGAYLEWSDELQQVRWRAGGCGGGACEREKGGRGE